MWKGLFNVKFVLPKCEKKIVDLRTEMVIEINFLGKFILNN